MSKTIKLLSGDQMVRGNIYEFSDDPNFSYERKGKFISVTFDGRFVYQGMSPVKNGEKSAIFVSNHCRSLENETTKLFDDLINKIKETCCCTPVLNAYIATLEQLKRYLND